MAKMTMMAKRRIHSQVDWMLPQHDDAYGRMKAWQEQESAALCYGACGGVARHVDHEFAISILDKMQAQEILRSLRLPEFDDFSQFFRSVPAATLVGLGAFAAVIAYWFASRPKAVKPPCNLLMQSEEVEDGDGARHSVLGDGPELLTHYYDDARTMYEVFKRGHHISENGPCLGSRKPNQPYEWLSYKEVSDRAEFLGSGLLYQGCKPSSDQFIGVFAQNRPEWIISELACYTYSMVVIPLYDTLGHGAIRYIINTELDTSLSPQEAEEGNTTTSSLS
ncbi:unnamed protein product [Ranitomeya imitator]|uniref:long-chain-fatty-acid--CoA ligase n=1 Tax=Ranitomeya imitator TaxID=111125 RepID=A0ABN9KU20_9NEOB|nr:unnamed protein product [Ranitomeya imitator]